MLKYTSVEHADHKLLKLALQDIHELAVNINNIEKETEQVEKDIKKLREIETCIEGTVEVSPKRTGNKEIEFTVKIYPETFKSLFRTS